MNIPAGGLSLEQFRDWAAKNNFDIAAPRVRELAQAWSQAWPEFAGMLTHEQKLAAMQREEIALHIFHGGTTKRSR